MNNWTEAQQQAIEARNCDLLVAAAAGSGKTAVLVERIIRMVCQDGLNIEDLLIVTFTNAAAAEMRERITAAVMQQLESNPAHAEHLRRQLQMVGYSSICTIHAFCTQIVRENFHRLDIDPKFRIGDDTECALLRAETIEEVLETAYGAGEEHFLGLVERFSSSRNDKPIEDLILRTYSFIQSQPEPWAWLDDKVNAFDLPVDELGDSSWAAVIVADTRNRIREAAGLFTRALAIIKESPDLQGYEPALADDLALASRLQSCLEEGLTGLARCMQTVSFTRLGRVDRNCDKNIKELVQELRGEGKKIIQDLQNLTQGKSLQQLEAELRDLYPSMQALRDLTAAFALLYKEKKNERGLLDFNDLEHYALQVLKDTKTAGIYRSRYQYIFVDEYQDINQVQENLLHYIQGERNLFMVGDVKQSIYRFRLADPTLFIAKYHAFQPDEGAACRRIDLGRNFRSCAEILNGVNFIFSHIMSEQLGEIDYDRPAFLYYGSGMETVKEEPIEVMLVEKDRALNALEEASEDLSDVEYEAAFAARRIKQLVGQNIYDPRRQCLRPLEYRDMVVLMRSPRGRADVYFDVLSEQGIPAYADVGNGYFAALEIEIFLNLLRLIDNKQQDVPLLSVLRSPIGRFTVQDLIAVRAHSRVTYMHQALEEYMADRDDELSGRLAAFWDRLSGWQEKARFMPIDQLIWEIMLESGYYYYVGAMPGGVQRQANLRILLDRARQFQTGSLKGLFNFVRFIDSLQAGGGDMGNARVLGEEDNVVRIMSIHKSKGLEFPVVILAGLGKQFNFSDTSANLLFHRELGLGPVHVDPELRVKSNSLPRMAIQNQLKKENLSEEIRILYVGCTRAINKLILLGSCKNLPALAAKWSRPINAYGLGKARNFMDWIGPVLMRHPHGEILRELPEDNGELPEIWEDDSCWNISVLSPAQLIAAADETQRQQTSLRHLLEDFQRDDAAPQAPMIYRRFDWEYPYRAAETIPSKLSVSSIKRSQTAHWPAGLPDPPMLLSGPQFIVNDNQAASTALKGAEKGTLIHFIMQHLDLKRVGSLDEIETQLQEMVERELLTAAEIDAVQTEKIVRFFASPLGRRVLDAPVVYRETPFNLVCQAGQVLDDIAAAGNDEELLVQGVIDLYFREGEELVLVDYKTDYVSASNRSDLVRQYRIQINLYKEALESILGKRVKESYLYFFHTEEMIEILD